MKNLATACDLLDSADSRIAAINELLGNTCGELSLSEAGMTGLCAIMRDIMKCIASARAVIDAHRGDAA